MKEYRILRATSTEVLAELVTLALSSPPGTGPKWELHGYVFISEEDSMFNQAMTKEEGRVYGGKYHDILNEGLNKSAVNISDEIAQRELENTDEDYG